MSASTTHIGGTNNLEAAPVQRSDILPLISPLFQRDTETVALGQGWTWRMMKWTTILAAPLTSQVITSFYTTLQEDALQWERMALPGRPVFTADFGRMSIEFSVRGAEGTVPWEFVAYWAGIMLEQTRKGFAGVYIATMLHDGGLPGLAIRFVVQGIGIIEPEGW